MDNTQTLLMYVIPEVLPPLLMGSALASTGSVLELTTLALSEDRAYRSFSQKALLQLPLLPKPCHTNLIQQAPVSSRGGAKEDEYRRARPEAADKSWVGSTEGLGKGDKAAA